MRERLYRHLSRLRVHLRKLILIAGLLFAVAQVAFVGSSVTGVGCSFCHVTREAARELETAAHSGMSCLSCHRAPGVVGALRLNVRAAGNLLSWAVAVEPEAHPGVRVSEARCLECHGDIALATVSGRKVRMSHKEVGREPYRCSFCHSNTAHLPAPGGVAAADRHALCRRCHTDGGSARATCDVCHESPPPKAANMDSDHPSVWETSHGSGDLSGCSSCHERAACAECHGVELPHDPATFVYTHGEEAANGVGACLACHAAGVCDECHGMEMPHADSYLLVHGQDAKDLGAEVCGGCHARSGCNRCHLRHIHPGVPEGVKDRLQRQGLVEGP